MKKTALALATVLTLTGAAFAENPNLGTSQTQQTQTQPLPGTLDLNSTGSIHDTSAETSNKPRLGYEGSPWFITNVN